MGCWGPCPLTFLLMPLNGAHMITGVAFSFSHKMLMNRRCLCECLCLRMQIVNPLKSILNAVVKAHRQKAKLEHICPVVLLKWLPDCEKMFHCCCIYEATVTTIRNWRSKLPASFKHDSLFLLLYVRTVCTWTINVTIFFCPRSGPRRRTWQTQTQTSHSAIPIQRQQHQFPGLRCMLGFTAACLHVYVFIYALILLSVPVKEILIWVCMLWNAVLFFMRDIPRSNLHEPFKFPYIVLFNTNHVIAVTCLTQHGNVLEKLFCNVKAISVCICVSFSEL